MGSLELDLPRCKFEFYRGPAGVAGLRSLIHHLLLDLNDRGLVYKQGLATVAAPVLHVCLNSRMTDTTTSEGAHQEGARILMAIIDSLLPIGYYSPAHQCEMLPITADLAATEIIIMYEGDLDVSVRAKAFVSARVLDVRRCTCVRTHVQK